MNQYLFNYRTHLSAIYWRIISKFWYKLFLKSKGRNSCIIHPLSIEKPNTISLGSNVTINKFSWFCSVKEESEIDISDGTCIGHFFHCVSLNKVNIGKNVLIADKVFVSDCTHDFIDIDIPIINQSIKELPYVSIGNDSWIGENVSIIGCKIGKHSIIGANSVVLSDIGDYCVAVGSPAKVIKKYNFITKSWEKY